MSHDRYDILKDKCPPRPSTSVLPAASEPHSPEQVRALLAQVAEDNRRLQAQLDALEISYVASEMRFLEFRETVMMALPKQSTVFREIAKVLGVTFLDPLPLEIYKDGRAKIHHPPKRLTPRTVAKR